MKFRVLLFISIANASLTIAQTDSDFPQEMMEKSGIKTCTIWQLDSSNTKVGIEEIYKFDSIGRVQRKIRHIPVSGTDRVIEEHLVYFYNKENNIIKIVEQAYEGDKFYGESIKNEYCYNINGVTTEIYYLNSVIDKIIVKSMLKGKLIKESTVYPNSNYTKTESIYVNYYYSDFGQQDGWITKNSQNQVVDSLFIQTDSAKYITTYQEFDSNNIQLKNHIYKRNQKWLTTSINSNSKSHTSYTEIQRNEYGMIQWVHIKEDTKQGSSKWGYLYEYK